MKNKILLLLVSSLLSTQYSFSQDVTGGGPMYVPGAVWVSPVQTQITATNINGVVGINNTFSNVLIGSGVINGSFNGNIWGATNLPQALYKNSVRDCGAKGDGVYVFDAGFRFVAGSVLITNQSASWTAADIGKVIMIYGAGSNYPYSTTNNANGITHIFNGTNYLCHVTGISNVLSPTIIVLSNAPISDGKLKPKTLLYGSDDTAAIQACINKVATNGGGTVFFPINSNGYAAYLVNGPIQDPGPFFPYDADPGSNNNAQLVIPRFPVSGYPGSVAPNIIFEGPLRPQLPYSLGNYKVSAAGATIVSTRNYQTNGALLSVQVNPSTGGAQYQSKSLCGVTFKDITIRMPTDTGMTAIDMRSALGLNFEGAVFVDQGYTIYSSCPDSGEADLGEGLWPTKTNSYGVRFPGNNNAGQQLCDWLIVNGFYNGISPGEHLCAREMMINDCVNGVVFTGNGHANEWQMLEFNQCQNCLVDIGFPISINCWSTGEVNVTNSPAWPPTIINSKPGTLNGVFNYRRTIANVFTNVLNGKGLLVTRFTATNPPVIEAGLQQRLATNTPFPLQTGSTYYINSGASFTPGGGDPALLITNGALVCWTLPEHLSTAGNNGNIVTFKLMTTNAVTYTIFPFFDWRSRTTGVRSSIGMSSASGTTPAGTNITTLIFTNGNPNVSSTDWIGVDLILGNISSLNGRMWLLEGSYMPYTAY